MPSTDIDGSPICILSENEARILAVYLRHRTVAADMEDDGFKDVFNKVLRFVGDCNFVQTQSADRAVPNQTGQPIDVPESAGPGGSVPPTSG